MSDSVPKAVLGGLTPPSLSDSQVFPNQAAAETQTHRKPLMSQSTPSALGEKQMAVLMAMLVALMPFSVDAYLPAIPEMAQSLSADIHRIEQSLVLFMFGVAFGQIVGGAVSDIKGRRPVALVGLSIYFAAVAALTMVQFRRSARG